jgi:hypothetical protein
MTRAGREQMQAYRQGRSPAFNCSTIVLVLSERSLPAEGGRAVLVLGGEGTVTPEDDDEDDDEDDWRTAQLLKP